MTRFKNRHGWLWHRLRCRSCRMARAERRAARRSSNSFGEWSGRSTARIEG